MKYIRQVLIILLISFVGEMCNYLIPIPIPGNIYGMILMFLLLCIGIIKVADVKETSQFLIDIMPILFIPSAVGIMTQGEILETIWIKLLIIIIVSTIIVMVVTGIVTQLVILHKKRRDKA